MKEKIKSISPLVAIAVFSILMVLLIALTRAGNSSTAFETSVVNTSCKTTVAGNEYILFGSDCGSSNSGFPTTYQGNLNLIKNASVTATKRVAGTPTDTEFGIPVKPDIIKSLDGGNPHLNTPTNQLDINDFVVKTGDRYANHSERPGGGVFHVTCQFSHFAYDDPIIFPNQPGKSHLHMFFGNTHSNAFSDSDSLLNSGSSTCSRGELNRTSYWVPALFDGNKNAIIPDQFMAYYENNQSDYSKLKKFPSGLRFVTGNAMATSAQNSPNGAKKPKVLWSCGWYKSASQGVPEIPKCDPSKHTHIEMSIHWPFCWNGKLGDQGNDYRTNLAYPGLSNDGYWSGSKCPNSHPQLLPRLRYRIHFKLSSMTTTTDKITLSSDVGADPSRPVAKKAVSIHGDWFGGWNPALLNNLYDHCIKAVAKSCDPEHLGDPAGRVFPRNYHNGELVQKGFLNSLRVTPQEITEYCPLRSQPTGSLYDLAYCVQDAAAGQEVLGAMIETMTPEMRAAMLAEMHNNSMNDEVVTPIIREQ